MTSNVPYVPLSICNIICSLEYLILNINYLVSFACSACWPFISTGNEEPALDKSIACTTQASQASRVTSVYIVLQMCPAGVPCRCFGNLFQKDDGWKSNKHCPKQTPKRTLWYLWWESIQLYSTVISCQQAFVSPYSEVSSDTQQNPFLCTAAFCS